MRTTDAIIIPTAIVSPVVGGAFFAGDDTH